MTQQQFETSSVIEIEDEVILASNDHLQGSPAISVSFLPADVNTGTNTITAAAHGLEDDFAVRFYTTDSLPVGLIPLQKYFVVNATTNTFQVALTISGAAISLSSGGSGTHTVTTGFAVLERDPWDTALSVIDDHALDPTTVVAGLDNALAPSSLNPYVTESQLAITLQHKTHVLVGPPGSDADYESSDQTAFAAAVAFLQARDVSTDGGWIVVKAGTYTFTSTLTIPDGIRIEGVHPNAVILQNSGNFPIIDVTGTQSVVSRMSLRSISSTTTAALKFSGQRSRAELCRIYDFGFAGVQLGGFRNTLKYCRIEQSVAVGSPAVIVQSFHNKLEHCSFAGTLSSGAVKIEGSGCGVFASYFASTLTGYTFNIISSSANDNRLVANYYGSAASLAASADFGTDTVRYANMPNTGLANQNNFLEPLREFTGQPTQASSVAALSNSFAHDPALSDNLSDILDQQVLTVAGDVTFFSSTIINVFPIGNVKKWQRVAGSGIPPNSFVTSVGVSSFTINNLASATFPGTTLTLTESPSLDLFVQKSFEERNVFVHSVGDITFDGLGNPTAGVLTWDGTTLTYPDFYIRSVFARQERWHVGAGSSVINSGEVLYVDLDQSLTTGITTLTPTVAPIPLALADPLDAHRLVLAFGLGGGAAVWLSGFRLLTGLTSFDVDGTPLPIVRFVGLTESRNPTPPPSGFSGAAQSDLTEKLGAQSAHLEMLFERTNLSFEPMSGDAEISTDPAPGDWIGAFPGIPATPTHVLELWGSTYGLEPATGLYRFNRESGTWVLMAGNPGTAPYTALSYLRDGLALLEDDGDVVYFDKEGVWSVLSPTLSAEIASRVPFASSRAASFQTGGQADYALQTPYHTYFTTLDGYTVRFSIEDNTLEYAPRLFTEALGEQGVYSHGSKDTGFNTLRDPQTLFETKDNGLSYTTHLPVGYHAKFLAFDDSQYDEFRSTDFAALINENFSHDPSSGAFIGVYRNNPTTKWYVIGGGRDTTYLYSFLETTAPQFSDFEAQFWAVNAHRQEVTAVGRQISTGAFAALRGYYDTSTDAWLWTNQVLGAASTCQGAIAVYDYYTGGANIGDLYVLVSNPSRGDRPSFWKRDFASGLWTFKTLHNSPSLGEDVLVAAAVSGSFDYTYPGNRPGYGVATPTGISFLVRDDARGARPTMFMFNRIATYTGVRLGSAAGPTVDVVTSLAIASSATSFMGGVYSAASKSVIWITEIATNSLLFAYHTTSSGWSSMDPSLSIDLSGKSGTHVTANNHLDSYLPAGPSYTFYVMSSLGISTVTLTGTESSFTASSVSIHSENAGFSDTPCFSNPYTTSYVSKVGALGGGEPSMLIGSWVRDNLLPVQGAGFGYDPNLGGGLFWTEPGTVVKNLGNGLWAGLNRGGYLWVADTSVRNRLTEFTPNPAVVRGDITLTSLGTTTDFDWSNSGGQIAFVFADAGNLNRMTFVLYTIATGTATIERAGFAPFNPAGVTPCGSRPRISYNVPAISWDIAVQDDSVGGNAVFYRREALFASWITQTITTGRSPSKPLIVSGLPVVAVEETTTANLKIAHRNSGGFWSVVGAPSPTISGGGYVRPELVQAGSRFWAFGNRDGGGIARVANSTSYDSGWASVSLTDVGDSYNRVTNLTAKAYSDGVAVASNLAVGAVPADQEIGIFRFYNAASHKCTVIAAKGRLQSTWYSGQEETSYSNLDFSPDGALVYKSNRPTLAISPFNPLWSIRISRNQWAYVGDSSLGSGRLLTIGERTYREKFCDDPDQTLLHETRLLTGTSESHVRNWTVLPLGERDSGNFTCLKYPHAAMGGIALFQTGNPTSGFADDLTLQVGSLGAVTAREFPLICGSTRIQGGPGASVLYHGAMLLLASPPSTTNLAYFGVASVGTSGVFRLEANNVLRINGTWRFFSPSDASRFYTLSGPLTFDLDASTLGHLVLEFPTPASAVLDPTANPLSYWANLDHPQTTFSLVLGELRTTHFFLYPSMRHANRMFKLTLGALEPREWWTGDISNIVFMLPQNGIARILGQRFFVAPVDGDSVTIKLVGSISGLQRMDFPLISGNRKLSILQGLPPNSTGFLYVDLSTIIGDDVAPAELENMRLDQIVGRYGDLVIFDA